MLSDRQFVWIQLLNSKNMGDENAGKGVDRNYKADVFAFYANEGFL